MDPLSREARQGVAEYLKTDPGPSRSGAQSSTGWKPDATQRPSGSV